MSTPLSKKNSGLSFADYVRRMREGSGLTQRELAEKLTDYGVRVSYRAIQTWEHGTSAPPARKQADVRAFGANLAAPTPSVRLFDVVGLYIKSHGDSIKRGQLPPDDELSRILGYASDDTMAQFAIDIVGTRYEGFATCVGHTGVSVLVCADMKWFA